MSGEITNSADTQQQDLASEELDSIIDQAVEKHGAGRDAVIPILSEVNAQIGYIPGETLGKLRRKINAPHEGLFLADSHLYSTASFYQMFSLKPMGKHVVRFCESAPCHVMGGRQVIEKLKIELGLQPGETTPDNQWTLIMTSCMGICGVGPAFMIDHDLYGNVTPDRVPVILARYS